MSRLNEDEAWREIVEHYGERPVLDETSEVPPADDTQDEALVATAPTAPEDTPELVVEEERFVPPPPPPLPRVEPKRLVAWIGLFGSPVVLLVFLLLGWWMPTWVGLGLVGAFVGGFLYLVGTMPRGPRDPFDDGSRV